MRYKPTFFIPEDAEALEAHYKVILPVIKKIAWGHGFAIGVHGSMRKDLDLMAFPWIEGHSNHAALLGDIQLAVCGENKFIIDHPSSNKPCGRQSYTLVIGMKALIDISVAPDVKAARVEGMIKARDRCMDLGVRHVITVEAINELIEAAQ